MTINDGTYSLEVGLLQSFLVEKFDENTLISNKYDITTHKKLLEYLQFPDVYGTSEIITDVGSYAITVGGTTRTVSYLFSIIDNIDKVSLIQKTACKTDEELFDICNGIVELKDFVHDKGWFLTYKVNADEKYIVEINPIVLKNVLPRKDLISMINQVTSEYVDDYYIDYTQGVSSPTRTPKEIQPSGSRLIMSAIATNAPVYPWIKKQDFAENFITHLRSDLSECWGDVDLSKPLTFECDHKSPGPGTKWKFTIGSSTYYLSSAGADIDKLFCRDAVFTSDFTIQMILSQSKKRLFIVNNIEVGKYYVLSHSNDVPSHIRVVFSDEDITSKGIKEGRKYNLIGNVIEVGDSDHTQRETGNTEQDNAVPVDGVGIVKASKIGDAVPKTMLVEMDIPFLNNEQEYTIPTQIIYGDLNFDGVLDSKDLEILDNYKTDINKYSYAQRVAMKHRNGDRTADYKSITSITGDDVEDIATIISSGKVEGSDQFIYANLPTEPKETLLYVGEVSQYIMDFYFDNGSSSELKNILNSFKGINFHEEPFMLHSKFMDYMLDSAIHKYSEEERIKPLYDLIGLNSQFEGYSQTLREMITKYQKAQSIPFQTGYVDVHTSYLLREE